MNGKFTKLGFVFTLVILCTVPAAIFVTRTTQKFWATQIKPTFEVRQINIKFKSIYSNKIKQNLLQAVSQNFNDLNFYEKMKQEFKIIKKIEWQRSDLGCVNMTITGVEPICKINGLYVLGDKRRLFELSQFEDFKLEQLHKVQISEKFINKKLDDQTYNFVRRIPDTMWNSFAINYINRSRIELNPNYSICKSLIIVDQQSFFIEKKIEMISAVFSDLTHKGFISEKVLKAKSYKLVFDLRDDNRILVKIFDSFKRGMGR
jgi:hypothetical protein